MYIDSSHCHIDSGARDIITRKPFREIATASPLAMPRNDRVLRTEKKKFCLLAKNGVIDLRFLFYPVQRTYVIARSNATWQSPGRVTAL